jgi:hypothetical protein
MIEKIKMSHDQGMVWLEEILPTINQEKCVDLFLASLSSREMEWRSGLPMLAVLKNYPIHKFSPENIISDRCPICGDHQFGKDDERNLEAYNQFKVTAGGLFWGNYSPVTMAFFVDQFSRIDHKKPSSEDINIFWEIIEIIKNSKSNSTANDIQKKIGQSKILKSNKEERRYLLDTFSLCGILETEEHKGYLNQFNDTVTRDQRERGAVSNDWGYPIRWWRRKDGISEQALEVWFGRYF